MSTTMIVILVIAALALVVGFVVRSRGNRSDADVNADISNRKCDNCEHIIPNDYMKSLCPECKTYLAR